MGSTVVRGDLAVRRTVHEFVGMLYVEFRGADEGSVEFQQAESIIGHRSLDPTGGGRARRAMRWKPALNAFALTFEGRLEAATH